MRAFRARALPAARDRHAVELRFVLERARRLTFVLYGPAPACVAAARLAAAGHRGINVLRFDGHVRHRLLPPGVYRVTPQQPGAAATVRGRPAVAVRVDVHGARPLARLPRLDCGTAAAPVERLSLFPPAGVAGVEGVQIAYEPGPAAGAKPAASKPSPPAVAGTPPASGGVLGFADSAESVWPTVALVGSLIWALLLLSLASAEWNYVAGRFRLVRVLYAHRLEAWLLGATFLVLATAMFVLKQLS